MNFTIEDRRNIELFVEILKAALANEKYLTISIDAEGWMLMQYPEQLDARENDKLVSIAWLQNSFFVMHNLENEGQTRFTSCTFELEISTLVKTLTSVKKQIKKITLMVKRGTGDGRRVERNERLGCLKILSSLEESQFLIEKKVFFNSHEVDRGFYKEKLKNFEEDTVRIFEMENEEFTFIKEFNNYFLDLLFHSEFIRIKPGNCPKDIVTDLNKVILNKYNYEALNTHYGGKTKLTVSPNFLTSYRQLCKKMNQNIEVFFGKSYNDHVNVYCKTANEKVTILMNFSAALEINDSDNQTNPFENQMNFQNINHLLNSVSNQNLERLERVGPMSAAPQSYNNSENNENAMNSYPDSNPFSNNNFLDSYQEPPSKAVKPIQAANQANALKGKLMKPPAINQPVNLNQQAQNNNKLKNKVSPVKDLIDNETTKRMKLNSFNDERLAVNTDIEGRKTQKQNARPLEVDDSMKIEEGSELNSYIAPLERKDFSQVNGRVQAEQRTQQSSVGESNNRPSNNAMFSIFAMEKNYLQSSAESTANLSAIRANLQRNERKVAENKVRREDMIKGLRPFD